MINTFLEVVKKQFVLEEKDVGEFKQQKVSGMKFEIQQFYAKDLGNISIMSAKGFLGLMKMDTFIVNPVEKDLPLFSYDRIHAMGNDTFIIELYDTMLGECKLDSVSKVKEQYGELPEHDLGTHWYDSIKLKESIAKKGKKDQTQKFDLLAKEYLEAYLNGANQLPEVNKEDKKKKASVYVEGLLEHGGPSTDVFKKKIGLEKTAELFRQVLFGTK